MKGIEQLDLLDATNSIVLARSSAGALNLDVVVHLPQVQVRQVRWVRREH